jgi:CHRD domain-containing protein/VCBS repeat protein
MASAQTDFAARLTGAQEVPTTGSTASGTGTVVLDPVAGTVTVNLSFQGLTTNEMAAHIHGNSLPGIESGIAIDLGVAGGTSGVHTTVVSSVTPAQIAALRAGLWYFNIHTGMFSGGEIRGQIQALTPLIGLGYFFPSGGWATVRDGRHGALQHLNWLHLPWPAYNSGPSYGELHPAQGDVDGDGLVETVVGLASGGQGYIAIFDDAAHNYALLRWIQVQWAAYNSTYGAVYPAVGNLDNDPQAEIVAGLGPGGGGWVEIFDDAAAGYAHQMFVQLAWPSYNAAYGETHPAIGDVDGDGRGEIVLGLGTGGGGWAAVLEDAAANFVHRDWLRTKWTSYNDANGATWPAAGDLDNDGRAEIVFGLGRGSGASSGQGYLQVVDDASAGYMHLRWLQVEWAAYTGASGSGETHPAIGNIDGDYAAELVIGLGPYSDGGWFQSRDDAASGYAPLNWSRTGWMAYDSSGGQTFPALWSH